MLKNLTVITGKNLTVEITNFYMVISSNEKIESIENNGKNTVYAYISVQEFEPEIHTYIIPLQQQTKKQALQWFNNSYFMR